MLGGCATPLVTAARLAMCMFNYRFFPAVCLARQMIRSGQLGTIHHMRVTYLQMAGHDPASPPEKVWYSAWPHSGVLQGIGSHAIDQCRFLVGEIASVAALVRTFHQDRALPTAGGDGAVADEATAATLEFACGAVGVLEASAVAFGHKNRLAWEINGSRGSVRWNLECPSSLWLCLVGEGATGFRRNLGYGEGPPLRGRLVAGRASSRLGARARYRDSAVPSRTGRRRKCT